MQAVSKELMESVKMVYTAGTAQVGSFGDESRMAYTFLISEFTTVLSALLETTTPLRTIFFSRLIFRSP